MEEERRIKELNLKIDYIFNDELAFKQYKGFLKNCNSNASLLSNNLRKRSYYLIENIKFPKLKKRLFKY